MDPKALMDARPLSFFRKGIAVKGSPRMSLIPHYSYVLEKDPGTDFPPTFRPYFTPGEMLALGVFEGKYLNDSTSEFPREWFLFADALGTLSPTKANVACNYFKVGSRQPLHVWRENGWCPSRGGPKADGKSHTKHPMKHRTILADPKDNPDERGWFQWYCRYWLGRRLPDLDAVQIGRWRSFVRHAGAIKARCAKGDLACSPKERQALLQWAHNPFI